MTAYVVSEYFINQQREKYHYSVAHRDKKEAEEHFSRLKELHRMYPQVTDSKLIKCNDTCQKDLRLTEEEEVPRFDVPYKVMD